MAYMIEKTQLRAVDLLILVYPVQLFLPSHPMDDHQLRNILNGLPNFVVFGKLHMHFPIAKQAPHQLLHGVGWLAEGDVKQRRVVLALFVDFTQDVGFLESTIERGCLFLLSLLFLLEPLFEVLGLLHAVFCLKFCRFLLACELHHHDLYRIGPAVMQFYLI